MLKEYNQAFGKITTLQQEKDAFVIRAEYILDKVRHRTSQYERFFAEVCYELAIRSQDFITRQQGNVSIPSLKVLAHRNFDTMLELLIAAIKVSTDEEDLLWFLDISCSQLLSRASTDLGIRYESGMFYPKGEFVLDQDLINHSLNVLTAYPAEDKDLRLALDDYRAGKKDGIVETCYRCMEGLTRMILKNHKTLIENKVEILRYMDLSGPTGKIMAAYIEFGNDYGRHASPIRHDASETEVEMYLYQTCLLIRLILKSKPSI